METHSTAQAARLLGVPPGYLIQYIWYGRIQAPGKVGARYRWTDADVASARKALGTDRRSSEYRRAASASAS